jgi:hypothetical protein
MERRELLRVTRLAMLPRGWVSGVTVSPPMLAAAARLQPACAEELLRTAPLAEDTAIADRARRRYIELLGAYSHGDRSIFMELKLAELENLLGIQGPGRRS